MFSYESTRFGLRMQIPPGWVVQAFPDGASSEPAKDAKSSNGSQPAGSSDEFRRLLVAYLYAPGSLLIDGLIELTAWSESDEYFLTPQWDKPLKTWNLNEIRILYEDFVGKWAPEKMYYRFARWKVAPDLWLYAKVQASGKRRFEYVLSIFETLAPASFTPNRKRRPLFQRAPWNVAPSFFRLAPLINDENDAPLDDLTVDSQVSDTVLDTNQAVLDRRISRMKWTPFAMRRRRRVRKLDCYYGPECLRYFEGIFSSRAIEVLRPYLKTFFVLLDCAVNGEPHYFLCARKRRSCLDIGNSEIERHDDGDIMRIKRYRFHAELVPDPLIFATPESRRDVFATVSIPGIIKEAGLSGIALYPVDGNGREYTWRG